MSTGRERVQRRLAAILAADVVGYSRMMSVDEAGTLAVLRAARSDLLDPAFEAHGGRVVKTMGDGFLVEFASAVDALRCAMAIQNAMAARKGDITFRIGVNVGDVVVDNDDILGDGVNIAARLEGIAAPGGVAISGAVHEYIGGRVEGTFHDAGPRELKNIGRSIHVWLWSPEPEAGTTAPTVSLGPISEPKMSLGAPPVPGRPSVAVLPFDNMSGDASQDFLADGVVESLTAALSRIRAFFVIARNSAFAYKGRAMNVREIGRDLGVAYVLEGSVQLVGPRVRITVQLIETEGAAHVWAERYDGLVDDIFDLQDRISEQVAGALQPSIRLAEVERARRKRPQDLGAYDYTMQAMRHVWMLEKTECARALSLLNQALQVDGDYPLALALAAWCHAQHSVYNWASDIDAALEKSLQLAELAAQLSVDDPLILTVLGTVHTFARHHGAARVLMQRALALDPNGAWAWSRLGWLDTYADRPDEATRSFEKALRLSPLDPMNFNNYMGLGSARQVAGDDQVAAEMFLRALHGRPNAHWIHRNLAPALWGAGRPSEARASFETMMTAYPDFTIEKYKKAMVFSRPVLDRIGAQLAELGAITA